MNQIVDRRYKDYRKKIGQSINNYFGIENPKNGTLEFSFKRISKKNFLFSIKYLHNPKYDFITLPTEINDIINSYIEEFIIVEYKIHFTDQYPFRPPKWSIKSVSDTYSNRLPITLYNYYKYIAKMHNIMNRRDWSSCINFYVDIIYFISKINHFDIFNEFS